MTTYILIGIAAWVFSTILIAPEMILSKYAELLAALPSWLAKPLGLCEYCLAGQLAFWYYIFTCESYSIDNHVLMVALSIFITELINILKHGRT